MSTTSEGRKRRILGRLRPVALRRRVTSGTIIFDSVGPARHDVVRSAVPRSADRARHLVFSSEIGDVGVSVFPQDSSGSCFLVGQIFSVRRDWTVIVDGSGHRQCLTPDEDGEFNAEHPAGADLTLTIKGGRSVLVLDDIQPPHRPGHP